MRSTGAGVQASRRRQWVLNKCWLLDEWRRLESRVRGWAPRAIGDRPAGGAGRRIRTPRQPARLPGRARPLGQAGCQEAPQAPPLPCPPGGVPGRTPAPPKPRPGPRSPEAGGPSLRGDLVTSRRVGPRPPFPDDARAAAPPARSAPGLLPVPGCLSGVTEGASTSVCACDCAQRDSVLHTRARRAAGAWRTAGNKATRRCAPERQFPRAGSELEAGEREQGAEGLQ